MLLHKKMTNSKRRDFNLAVLQDDVELIEEVIKSDLDTYNLETVREYFQGAIVLSRSDKIREYLLNVCEYIKWDLPKKAHAVLYKLCEEYCKLEGSYGIDDFIGRFKFLLEVGTEVNLTVPLRDWNGYYNNGRFGGRQQDLFSMITFYFPDCFTGKKGVLCSLLLKYGYDYDMFRRHPLYSEIYNDFYTFLKLHHCVLRVHHVYRYMLVYYRIFPYVVATRRGIVPQDFVRVLISFFVPYLSLE